MDVLVAVEMSGTDAGGEDALNLGVVFALDGIERNAAGDQAEEERFGVAEEFAGGVEERSEESGIGDGPAFGEIEMDTDGERGSGAGGGDGFVEGGGVGEEAGGGDDAGAIGLEDGAVDAGGHAEIVCVDDELLHEARAAGGAAANGLLCVEYGGDATGDGWEGGRKTQRQMRGEDNAETQRAQRSAERRKGAGLRPALQEGVRGGDILDNIGAEIEMTERAGRVLAIDYGRRRLGLAVCDEGRMVARPVETMERVNRRADVARLRRIVRDEGVKQLVVGLPLRLDGTAGEMAEEAREFAGRIAKALRLPVALVDERLTSWEASEEAPTPKDDVWGARAHGAYSKAHRAADGVDSRAAALILEEYLRGKVHPRGEEYPRGEGGKK